MHSEASVPGSQVATSLALCSYHLFFVCMWRRESAHSLVCLLIGTLVLTGQGSALVTSFNAKYLLVSPVSKYSHSGGEGFNT